MEESSDEEYSGGGGGGFPRENFMWKAERHG